MPPCLNSYSTGESSSIYFQDGLFFLTVFSLFTDAKLYLQLQKWLPLICLMQFQSLACTDPALPSTGRNTNIVWSASVGQFLQEWEERTATACSNLIYWQILVWAHFFFIAPAEKLSSKSNLFLKSFGSLAFHNCLISSYYIQLYIICLQTEKACVTAGPQITCIPRSS